jgi:hypothetical protein
MYEGEYYILREETGDVCGIGHVPVENPQEEECTDEF